MAGAKHRAASSGPASRHPSPGQAEAVRGGSPWGDFEHGRRGAGLDLARGTPVRPRCLSPSKGDPHAPSTRHRIYVLAHSARGRGTGRRRSERLGRSSGRPAECRVAGGHSGSPSPSDTDERPRPSSPASRRAEGRNRPHGQGRSPLGAAGPDRDPPASVSELRRGVHAGLRPTAPQRAHHHHDAITVGAAASQKRADGYR
jgi:hypothetical protein